MAACITPMPIRNKITGEWQTFPCGKCPECVKRRVSGWSFRLLQEDRVAQSSIFLTLTYDTKSVPITPKGYMSLCKRDVQLFMKRLRKNSDGMPIKYYVVGEYGTKKMRPHYHFLIFNATPYAITKSWCNKDGTSIGDGYFGTVTGASIGYCFKYMSKPSRIPLHRNDDRVPEFALMSKGLGKAYLSKAMNKWHLDDKSRMYCVVDGKKIAMPRYYKDKIYTEVERKAVAAFMAEQAKIVEEKKMIEAIQKYGDMASEIQARNHIAQFEKMHRNAKGTKVTVF